jgi:hypothetical protein
MSCIPPHDILEEDHRMVMLYPSCSIGVSTDQRALAIVLNHPNEDARCPALLCTEKNAVKIIEQLQDALRLLSQLPVPPSSASAPPPLD